MQKLGLSENEYKKKVTKIRKKVFADFESNLQQAKKSFAENSFVVHEANSPEEARAEIEKILQKNDIVAKTKTNTGKEIEIEKALENVDFFETDLGDAIVQLFHEEDQHYVLPAIHITAEKISQKIKEVYGDEVVADAQKLTRYLCNKIRQNILRANVGITGANFFTKSGQIVLLENEGNISLVSRLPQKHIVLVGIDKLVETVEDATTLCRTAAIFGTGQNITQYISTISGPSKTADIENELVMGAQGAREVHVILLDNGRSEMPQRGFGELMRCINCGACINFCPIYHQIGNEYGGSKYIGSKGVVSSALSESLKKSKENRSFDCTLCGNCSENCPMSIPLDEMVKKIRELQNEEGLQTEQNKKMLQQIKKHGNPFGEVDEDEIPDKLYCC